jgi:hypothetical protein
MLDTIVLLLLVGIFGFVIALPFIALGCIWIDFHNKFKTNYTNRFYGFLFNVKIEKDENGKKLG